MDPLKLRSHMRGAVAERRRADFDIPAPLQRVGSHIRGADAGGSAIYWGQWWFGARGFEADAANWVLDPFLAGRILLPLHLRSATAHVWTHVMICVEANFPPAPARVRPRMCERTFRAFALKRFSTNEYLTSIAGTAANSTWWFIQICSSGIIWTISSANCPLEFRIKPTYKCTRNHTYWGLKNNRSMQSNMAFKICEVMSCSSFYV